MAGSSSSSSSGFPFVMYGGPTSQDPGTGRFVRQYVMRDKVKPPRGSSRRKSRSRTPPQAAARAEFLLRIPLRSKISIYEIGWLGGGRSDPFAQYPIEMDLPSLEVVEYC